MTNDAPRRRRPPALVLGLAVVGLGAPAAAQHVEWLVQPLILL